VSGVDRAPIDELAELMPITHARIVATIEDLVASHHDPDRRITCSSCGEGFTRDEWAAHDMQACAEGGGDARRLEAAGAVLLGQVLEASELIEASVGRLRWLRADVAELTDDEDERDRLTEGSHLEDVLVVFVAMRDWLTEYDGPDQPPTTSELRERFGES
jgi:hypothetical protein